MTEIERKALALLQDCGFHGGYIDRKWNENYEALCRAIEQHEQFKQEVSDAVEDYCGYVPPDSPSHPIARFILPNPVDPLVEIADAMKETYCPTKTAWARNIRQALAARGLKIVEVE